MATAGLEKSGVDPTAIRVVQLLRGEFLRARGLERVQAEATNDDIRRDLRGFGYHRVDARPPEAEGGGRGLVPLTIVFFYGVDWNATKLKPILSQLHGVQSRGAAKAETPSGKKGTKSGQSARRAEIILVMAKEGQKSGVVAKISEVRRAVRGVRVSLLPLEPFTMNPLENIGVPPHRVLTRDEKKVVMGDLRATERNIPVMEGTDAVAVWLGAVPGDLVEIERISASGPALAYRIVRDPAAWGAEPAARGADPTPAGGAGKASET